MSVCVCARVHVQLRMCVSFCELMGPQDPFTYKWVSNTGMSIKMRISNLNFYFLVTLVTSEVGNPYHQNMSDILGKQKITNFKDKIIFVCFGFDFPICYWVVQKTKADRKAGGKISNYIIDFNGTHAESLISIFFFEISQIIYP